MIKADSNNVYLIAEYITDISNITSNGFNAIIIYYIQQNVEKQYTLFYKSSVENERDLEFLKN